MASSASPAKSSKLVTRLMSSSLSTPDRALETRTLLSWRQRQARAYRCWFPCEQGGLRTSIGAEASESDIVTAFLLLARGTQTLDWCAQTRGGGGRIKRPLPQYYLLTSLPKGKMAKKLRTICFKPSQRKKKKILTFSLFLFQPATRKSPLLLLQHHTCFTPKYQQPIVITRTKKDGPGRKKTRNGTAAHPRLYRPRSQARPRPVVPWPCPTGPPLFPPFACHFSSFAPAAAILSSPAAAAVLSSPTAARTTSARHRHHRRGARRVCRTDPRRTRR